MFKKILCLLFLTANICEISAKSFKLIQLTITNKSKSDKNKSKFDKFVAVYKRDGTDIVRVTPIKKIIAEKKDSLFYRPAPENTYLLGIWPDPTRLEEKRMNTKEPLTLDLPDLSELTGKREMLTIQFDEDTQSYTATETLQSNTTE